MKSGFLFFLLMAAGSGPATAITVESATGDWSKLPHLSQRGYGHLGEKMQAKLFEIAQSKQCPDFALTEGRLDFRITFAVQYAVDGSLSRLILPKLGCADAEGVTGGALLEMLQAGDYAPTGESRGGWYEGELGFSFAGESARNPAVVKPSNAQTQKLVNGTHDPNEVVCQKVEEIGSRLATNRICMSRAQWAQQERSDRDEINRLQTQRGCKDISGC
jgi:hypothetical protein